MDFRKIYESKLKEDISEQKGEILSDSLEKISEWIGSVWEKELPKNSWRTERLLYKICGFKIYSKGIYVRFSFVDEDGDTDGHIYEITLEDWFNKKHLVKAK